MFFCLLAVATALNVALAIPAGPVNTCSAVAEIVTVLHVNTIATSFCSTFLSIQTKTATITSTYTAYASTVAISTTGTITNTAATVTITASASTLTASPTITTTTIDAVTVTADTVTLTADASYLTLTIDAVTVTEDTTTFTAPTTTLTLSAPTITVTGPTTTITALSASTTFTTVTTTAIYCGGATNAIQRRRLNPSHAPTQPPHTTPSLVARGQVNLPPALAVLKAFASTQLSSACNCLSLPTPTTTSTAKITVTATITAISNVAASTVTTPTTTYTPVLTTIPTVTATFTPTSTYIPSTTFTPTETDTFTPTSTYTPTTTFTPTTTVTTTATVPGVVLSSPTPLTGTSAAGLAPSNLDDQYVPLTLPFSIQLYGTSATTVYIGVNGWLGLTQPCYTSSNGYFGYGSGELLAPPLPVSCANWFMPTVAFAPFWEDLYIYQGTPQGLYYQISGTAPTRSVSFEYYTSEFNHSTSYYHFVATFQENNPGAAIFDYYQVSDAGAHAVVGVQNNATGQVAQYSRETTVITPGLELVYDPATNTFTAGTIANCVLQST
ncbi:hypothetical protein K461DRAFT_313051 [Myriangium duriaei CBS 260.36]|uniref:PA14 domain-containing protein n=1 Tax=Myriangium duriaei CBS 260.36 TaxID=1168546 RepID=A0A9P4MJQ7_9PEZI|nr:hypothetical protein K461DRAFT_313051 [Myriangium duriaei CBS 260.36]